jgi:hypothetical protein
MQDGWEVDMDGFLHGIEMGHVSRSLGLLLGDHGTQNAYNHLFIYSMLSCMRTRMDRNSLK